MTMSIVTTWKLCYNIISNFVRNRFTLKYVEPHNQEVSRLEERVIRKWHD